MLPAAASPSLPDSLPLFNALPGANLLLSTDLRIVAASDDYLAATLTDRATLVGQSLFDAFPDNPAAPEAHATGNLRASLTQVLATGQPHQMAPQHYDVPDPARPGSFVKRHWLPTNRPVRDAAGRVTHLIHTVVDITDQHRTGRVLRESQAAELAARADAETQRQRLYRVLMNLPAQVATYHGPAHVYTLVNQHYQDYFPAHALLGHAAREAMPEINQQGLFDRLDQVYTTGEPAYAQELPVQLSSAGTGPPKLIYINASYLPLRDAAGNVDGVLDFSYNVTEQVVARQQLQALNQDLEARVQARAQEALALQADLLAGARQQAHEREAFHNIFEQTPALIALLRAPGHRVEYVNPAYQRVFPGRQLVGMDLAEAVPELVAQGFIAVLDRVYQTGEPDAVNDAPFVLAPAPGRAGRTAYYNISYQAYRENGVVAGVSIFAFDVTEQVLARQEREAQRQRLHDLFMQAPAAICILTGPDLEYELVNPGYQALFPGRSLLGRPILEALPEIAGHAVHRTFRQVYDTGLTHPEMGILIPIARPDGTLEDRYFNYIQQARREAHGQPDGVLVFAFEVTEQVRARQQVDVLNQDLAAMNEELQSTNDELHVANTQLTRTNVDLDNFIYTASHDLKVPIANIESLLQAFARKLPPEALVSPVPELLQRMRQSTERFRRTIEQLTDLTRLQQAHNQPATQVSLAAVVEEVRLDLLPLVEQAQARLDVDVPANAQLPFSEKNLRSVLYNLLSNALKYRHPDRPPYVQLTYFRQDRYHVVRVQDNGLGFDVATSESKLFGMFQRLHTHVEGSGIGLYMVKKMVENGGGRIDVASQVGEGTTFTVFIPVHPAS